MIPIFNFWLSYKALKEVWQASIDPQHWHCQRVPDFLAWWAICWGGSMLLYLFNPEAVFLVLLYVAVDVGRNLLTIKVLNQVTALQTIRCQEFLAMEAAAAAAATGEASAPGNNAED